MSRTRQLLELATAERKHRVSQLRLRGFSIDSIVYLLSRGDNALLNPSSNAPYARSTIAKDIAEMVQVTTDLFTANAQEHKRRQFDELQEVKRAAWSGSSLSAVLRALELEMKLLGTTSPVKVELTIVTRLIEAIEKTGKDPNPVLQAMITHLEAKANDG